MNLIPFDSSAQLPAHLAARGASINADVAVGAAFPKMSIKGKNWSIVRDGKTALLMKPDSPDEVAQHIEVVILRANTKAKTYYQGIFSEGDDAAVKRPDCYSYDGIRPSANSAKPQSKSCAACPHNVWGSTASGEGKMCKDNARLAIAAVDKLDAPMLLIAPPASLKPFREAVKAVSQRKLDYNMVVMRVGFDPTAATPKLTFKPVSMLDAGTYAAAQAAYEDETVRAIVGLDDIAEAPNAQAGALEADELDAALALKAANPAPAVAKPAVTPVKLEEEEVAAAMSPRKAAPEAKPAVATALPVTQPAPVTATKIAAAPTVAGASGAGDLLADIDELLAHTDN